MFGFVVRVHNIWLREHDAILRERIISLAREIEGARGIEMCHRRQSRLCARDTGDSEKLLRCAFRLVGFQQCYAVAEMYQVERVRCGLSRGAVVQERVEDR